MPSWRKPQARQQAPGRLPTQSTSGRFHRFTPPRPLGRSRVRWAQRLPAGLLARRRGPMGRRDGSGAPGGNPRRAATAPLAVLAGRRTRPGLRRAVDPVATRRGSAPIRKDGQEKSPREHQTGRTWARGRRPGHGCGPDPAAGGSVALPGDRTSFCQSLTRASGPCQDSPPTGAGNSRFPRHAPRRLGAAARLIRGHPRCPRHSCGRWGERCEV